MCFPKMEGEGRVAEWNPMAAAPVTNRVFAGVVGRGGAPSQEPPWHVSKVCGPQTLPVEDSTTITMQAPGTQTCSAKYGAGALAKSSH